MPHPHFNLDMEQAGTDALPEGWIQWGEGEVAVDSVAHSGRRSTRLMATGMAGEFSSAALMIPGTYSGSTIALSGYLRMEGVTEGYAGLLIRVNGPGGEVLGFEHMQEKKLNGTRDWQEYSITMDYPEAGKEIYVAGMLAGNGTVWMDNFTVRIDGEDIQTLNVPPPTSYAADQDHAFDRGSGVSFPKLTPQLIADLDLLGRVWGFLKYHHPTIARGERQWDYDLFRFLPRYLEAETHAERETLLEQWVWDLGDVPACTECADSEGEDLAVTADKSWINDRIANPSLRQLLTYIYKNRATGTHYYVAAGNVGNAAFQHELPYDSTGYPDAGFRLLAVYRYWNMIRYYFPYVEQSDRDWGEVLSAYIPKLIKAEDELAYERAALELIGEVGDTHAGLWGGADRIRALRGDRYAPVTVRFAEGELVVSDNYPMRDQLPATLEVGDVITHIEEQPVDEIVAERRSLYPASNDAARHRDLATDLLRGSGESITVRVETEAGEEARYVPLLAIGSQRERRGRNSREATTFKFLTADIGYVTLENIQPEEVPIIRDTFQNTRGLIIDIRNYPSTFVPFTLGSYFMSDTTPFVRFTRPVYDTPGTFAWSEPLEIPPTETPYTGRVVVLVNEETQSQAEYTSMAFRAGPRTTIIGSTTAGADGNVSTIWLPGGLRTMISGIGVFYPDKRPTQRIGIVPDIEVPVTAAGIRAGKDELLERAVALIQAE